MKAIRVSEYGGPSVLKLEEVPTPQPGPGQVLVRHHAVGINPVDTYLRSNTDNRGPKLPYTPGGDGGGVIEAVGAGVRAVKPGDRVYGRGRVGSPSSAPPAPRRAGAWCWSRARTTRSTIPRPATSRSA